MSDARSEQPAPNTQAAALAGDVAHRREPALAFDPRDRYIDLDAVCVERKAGERHVLLPADQRADPAAEGLADPKTTGVTLTPDRALRVGRHQLAVPIQHRAVGSDQDYCVVKRKPGELGITLTDPAHNYDLALRRRLTQWSQIVGLQVNAVGQQPAVYFPREREVVLRTKPPDPAG